MADSKGAALAREIRRNVAALRDVGADADEALASRAPEGRWSPREIVSHLCGPEGSGLLPILRAFIDKDEPTLDLVAEQTYMDGERAEMSLARLVDEAGREYEAIAAFTEGLSDEQLARTARIPMLKNSPLGERPTLEAMIGGLGGYHLSFHVDHLREILAELRRRP